MRNFNILDIFKLDYISDRKLRQMDKVIRTPVKTRSLTTEFRPHDRDRGQEISGEYSFQIPFRQQKQLYQRNPWVKRCIDHISSAAAGLNWHIIPKEKYREEMETDQHMQTAKVLAEELFNRPNTFKQSFSDLIKMIVRDVKIMDAAAIEKGRDSFGRLITLKVIDASTLKIDIDERGQIIKYVQEFRGNQLHGMYTIPNELANARDPHGSRGIDFDPTEVIYLRLNPRSEGPYGSSPIASLVEAIYADLATDINLYHFLNTGGVNTGYMSVGPNIDNDQIERIKIKFRRSLSPGMRYEFPIISSEDEVKWESMQVTNVEAQMAELQGELRNKILAVLSIPPNELGLSGNTRGQVYSQQDVFWGNAIIPMMKSIAEKFTNEILAEFDDRLMFEFLPPSEYQYEAIMARITTLEQEGLIEDDLKYQWLGLTPPKEPTYVQKKKELELRKLAVDVYMVEMQALAQYKNKKYILDEPRLQYQQLQAETQQMMGGGQASQGELDIQNAQIDVQKKQIELEKLRIMSDQKMFPDEMELKKLQIQAQILEAQSMMAQNGSSSNTPQAPLTMGEIVHGIQSGEINTQTLAVMIEKHLVDPEQLKLINVADRTVSGIIKDAEEVATQKQAIQFKKEKINMDRQKEQMKYQQAGAQHQNKMADAQFDQQKMGIQNQGELQNVIAQQELARNQLGMRQQQMEQRGRLQQQNMQAQQALGQQKTQVQQQQLSLQQQQMQQMAQNPQMAQQGMQPQQQNSANSQQQLQELRQLTMNKSISDRLNFFKTLPNILGNGQITDSKISEPHKSRISPDITHFENDVHDFDLSKHVENKIESLESRNPAVSMSTPSLIKNQAMGVDVKDNNPVDMAIKQISEVGEMDAIHPNTGIKSNQNVLGQHTTGDGAHSATTISSPSQEGIAAIRPLNIKKPLSFQATDPQPGHAKLDIDSAQKKHNTKPKSEI